MKREHDFRYCVSLVQEPTRNRSSTPEDTDGFQTAARVDDPGIRGIPVFCRTTIVGTVHKREPGQHGIYRIQRGKAHCVSCGMRAPTLCVCGYHSHRDMVGAINILAA